MKLNPECMRQVLLYLDCVPYVKTAPNGKIYFKDMFIEDVYGALPGYSREDVYYAVFNLEQAGYIDAANNSGESPGSEFCINFMTFAGHEFLEKIRSDGLWDSAVKTAEAVGNRSLSAVAVIADAITASEAGKLVGGG